MTLQMTDLSNSTLNASLLPHWEGLKEMQNMWGKGTKSLWAYFKVRYPKQELEDDPFMDYHEDQNVSMPTKMPFGDSLDSLPYPTA
ncbi:hypothetical protein B296_00005392 [Ensete ventricosum]|uniref:Uncharacterized protein n=1 Tax=Ensete ventricosum TaxID=4639 RepID=A0A427AC97_ENSVE|nr:hypothetical protein B296_00005392 [Ensete ventricosum]